MATALKYADREVDYVVAGMTRTVERLRMAKELSAAYEEGKSHRKQGGPREWNPYPSSSGNFHRWYAGWDEADQADRMDLIKVEKATDLRKD